MADEVRYVAERYGITERQAILFCGCMERGPRRVDYDDLASHLDVSNIRILSYAEDIDALVRRRLLRPTPPIPRANSPYRFDFSH